MSLESGSRLHPKRTGNVIFALCSFNKMDRHVYSLVTDCKAQDLDDLLAALASPIRQRSSM